VPSDFVLKVANTMHRTLMRASGNRLGASIGSMPVLELTTTGRKSGQPRAVMLTTPLQEGDTIVVVASRGGDDIHPAWYHNLVANPDVEVAYQGASKRPFRASVASTDERARLWPQITSKYKNYAGYQTRTAREIPLVLLTPRG
jgi:deazaflavin-dependent oxidoreductase (nitroreductase family)